MLLFCGGKNVWWAYINSWFNSAISRMAIFLLLWTIFDKAYQVSKVRKSDHNPIFYACFVYCCMFHSIFTFCITWESPWRSGLHSMITSFIFLCFIWLALPQDNQRVRDIQYFIIFILMLLILELGIYFTAAIYNGWIVLILWKNTKA